MRVTHRLMETTIAACLGTALLLLSSLTAVAGQPGGPDFTPGFYRVTPVDRNSRASETPQLLCAADAQALLNRKSGVAGRVVTGRGALGGTRNIKKQKIK